MKIALICVFRTDCLKVGGQEYQKTIISEKKVECFTILCVLSFLCLKLLMLFVIFCV